MDKLMFGLSVAAIGMLVVFTGLVILIFCIKAITKLAGAGSKKPEKKKESVYTDVCFRNRNDRRIRISGAHR